MALGFSTVVFFLGFSTAEYINGGNEAYFFQDHLTPYSEVEDGSRRIPREVSDCQHVKWDNRTFEELLVPRPSEVSSVKAQVFNNYLYVLCISLEILFYNSLSFTNSRIQWVVERAC